MEISKTTIVPVFIEAKSPEALIEKMMTNNHINGKAYNYFQVMKDGKRWLAWYYGDPFNDRKVK